MTVWKCLSDLGTMKLLSFSVIFSLYFVTHGKIDRPRGVPISKSSLYVAGSDFTCLDGSMKVPFDHINDDYCDCGDGSDEPGTSACPNGSFHCTNAGHSPLNIPSSRVNDGICDCCDATDEYDSRVQCPNTCREMGRAAREEREKMKVLVSEGHQIYKEYSQQGTEAKKERQAELSKLQQDKDELEARKNELLSLKEEAEMPEKESKDAHQKKWDEEKAQIQQERDQQKCEEAFKELDYNGDSSVSIEEMKLHPEFDIDSNGEVTEEEAKEYLEDKDSVDLYTFQTEVWPNIKEIYKKPEPQGEEPPTQEVDSDNIEEDYGKASSEQVEEIEIDTPDVVKQEEEVLKQEESQSSRDIQKQILELNKLERETEKRFKAEVERLLKEKELESANNKITEMTNKIREIQRQKVELGNLKKKVRKEERDRDEREHAERSKKLQEEKRKQLEKEREERAKRQEEKKKVEKQKKEEMYEREKSGKPSGQRIETEEHLPRSDDPVTDTPVDIDPDKEADDDRGRGEYYDEEDDRYDHDDEEDYDEHEDYEDEDMEHDDDIRTDADKDMPEYDESTKILIAAADKARAEFNEAESQFKTAESKLNELNKFLSLDLGPDNQFYPIKDSCYEFTDREYTYKFCPYDKATQRSKSGGSETSLGRWGRWDGPEGNRYAVMLMENGQGCWNGPNRSVKVHIKCGLNNELVSASEPNRCEYEYQFLSPTACNKLPEDSPKDIHEEL